jgi:hypothetical protein
MELLTQLLSRPEFIERIVNTLGTMTVGAVGLFYVWKQTLKTPMAQQSFEKCLGVMLGLGLLVRYLYYSGPLAAGALFTTYKVAVLTTIATMGACFLIWRFQKQRRLFWKLSLSVGVVINSTLPFFYTSPYDFPALWIPVTVDLVMFIFFCQFLGGFLSPSTSRCDQVVSGVAAATFLALGFTLLNAPFLPLGAAVIKWAISIYFLVKVWTTQHFDRKFSDVFQPKIVSFAIACYLVPTVSSFFEALPADADITTILEFVGYHMQGQSLLAAQSGLPGETLHFRYPAGLSALAYGMMWLLHIGAAQSLYLLWFFSYALMIFSVISFCRAIRLDPLLAVIFCISFTVLGWQGFGGGQVQEQLSYSLSIFSLSLLINRRVFLSALTLSAAAIIQPMVVIPFVFAFGASAARHLLIPFKMKVSEWVPSVFIFGLTFTYFTLINQGSEIQSQPAQLLSELTPILFVKNVLYWFSYDTAKLFPLLLVIPWVLLRNDRLNSITKWTLGAWFVGVILLDGLFGATHWTARNHAGFSIIALFAICPALLLYHLKSSHSSERTIQRITAGLLVLWLLQFAPIIPVLPNFALTTRDDVNMGHLLDRELPKESLIMNTTFPGVTHYYSWPARGESGRNTVISRIGDHQLTKMTKLSRKPYQDCITGDISTMSDCLRPLGVTHVWFSSQGMKEEHLEKIGIPDFRVGNSVAFTLK